MDIGIITFQRSVSYGAFFQAYALSRYLTDAGHNVKIIDYNPAHRDSKVRPWNRRWHGLHPQNLVNLYYRFCFTRYVERYLPLTERRYRTLQDLRDTPPAMDAYICGSDQIWNPRHTGGSFDPAYFCSFGTPDIGRIAYAPSFGTDRVAPELEQALSDSISHLDHVSAREKSGCALIERVTGIHCAHVLDPTLLNSHYEEFLTESKVPKKPYVLVFSLAHSALLHQVADVAGAKIGLPTVTVASHFKVWQYGGRFRFCSPGDWLNLFSHARAVITDSFHGTAFALRFHKPFVSVGLPGSFQDRNTRITDLLASLGLAERFVADSIALENVGQIEVDPNWPSIDRLLATMADQSVEYLAGALSTQGAKRRDV